MEGLDVALGRQEIDRLTLYRSSLAPLPKIETLKDGQ